MDYVKSIDLVESTTANVLRRLSDSCLSAVIELTSRCNNNCRHCYINRPVNCSEAKAEEMSGNQLKQVVDELSQAGSLWCLLTGGEPLLREDFFDIYQHIHHRGMLTSVFTNATLITDEHTRLFKEHRPRDIEITMYGATEQTYESITRKEGSFAAFMRGLDRLENANIPFRMKAVLMRSNLHEFDLIGEFCRLRTKDNYRFDPVLHLRYDKDPARNAEIIAERLSPDEIANLDRADENRQNTLLKNRQHYIFDRPLCTVSEQSCSIFSCDIEHGNIVIGPDGTIRACQDLFHPAYVCKSRQGAIEEDYRKLITKVRSLRTTRHEFSTTCHVCQIKNLCLCCPARADLEHCELDRPVDYFCKVAHARARIFGFDTCKLQKFRTDSSATVSRKPKVETARD